MTQRAYYVLSFYPIKKQQRQLLHKCYHSLYMCMGPYSSQIRSISDTDKATVCHKANIHCCDVDIHAVYTSESFIYSYVQHAAWHVDPLGNSRIFYSLLPQNIATILTYTYSLFSISYVDNCKYSVSLTFNRLFSNRTSTNVAIYVALYQLQLIF